MRLREIRQMLNAEVICGEEFLDLEIEHAGASDLMSDVLAFGKPGLLLITGLSNAQSVRTASIIGAKAIVYVRGKKPDQEGTELAVRKEIPLLSTNQLMYRTCGLLFSYGLSGIEAAPAPEKTSSKSEENAFVQEFEIKGGDFSRAGKASVKIMEMLREVGVDPAIVSRTSIASYEAEMNIVMYARRGTFTLCLTPDAIHLTVHDEGQGIPDIELAMKEGYSTATNEMREMGFGAGMGLPNIKKNSDRFKIRSEVGQGTELEIWIDLSQGRSA
ncbi:MAG: ATP-binding protein [Candidatus Aminicenantales bacterium]